MKKIVIAGFVATLGLSLATSPLLASAAGVGVGLKTTSSHLSASIKVSDKDNHKENNNKEKEVNVNSTTSLSSLPLGIQHAPGIQKRIDDGKGLPPGIFAKIYNFFFHKDDKSTTTPPVVDVVQIKDIHAVTGTTTASLVWNTNVQTTSQLLYGTSSVLSSSSNLVSNNSLTYSHEIDLSALTPDTTYFFMITAKDSNGIVKTTQVLSFKTKALDTVAPSIVFVTTVPVTSTTTRIVWVTNELADSKVWASTTTPVSTSTTPTATSSALSLYHDVTLSNLSTSTQYFYTVGSTDASGNASVVSGNSFTTSM